MKKRTVVIPKTRAKTAYAVLSAVARIAKEEPKRIDMNYWKLEKGDHVRPRRGFPACGTVGCIGGWVGTLTNNSPTIALGIDNQQYHELFYPDYLLKDAQKNAQTRSHADAVVAHIRAFQKKYAAQLKAKRV